MSDIELKLHPRFNILVSYCGTIIKNPETGHIYKQHKTGNGYLRVEFRHRHNGIKKVEKELVHRLVAETYIPNPYKKPEVDHKDRVRNNPHGSNLRWATRKQNIKNRRYGKLANKKEIVSIH